MEKVLTNCTNGGPITVHVKDGKKEVGDIAYSKTIWNAQG
jgi:hypothetical protein